MRIFGAPSALLAAGVFLLGLAGCSRDQPATLSKPGPWRLEGPSFEIEFPAEWSVQRRGSLWDASSPGGSWVIVIAQRSEAMAWSEKVRRSLGKAFGPQDAERAISDVLLNPEFKGRCGHDVSVGGVPGASCSGRRPVRGKPADFFSAAAYRDGGMFILNCGMLDADQAGKAQALESIGGFKIR